MDKFFVTAPRGVEQLLGTELHGLGVDARVHAGGAAFTGALACAYRVCLWSRLANRVLLELARFPAATPQQLYDGTAGIAWFEHLDPAATLAVDFHTRRSAITHSQFGAQKVKDAVVDQLRAQTGSRPSVALHRPDLRINVFLDRDEARLYLDLSGESLHRRGYRHHGGAAPLKENLAAAVLIRGGWPETLAAGGSLIDPMCGSGTLAIEAAMMATGIAPGSLREYFGFTRWKQHRADLWRELLAQARCGIRALPRGVRIAAYDHDSSAVAAARANAAAAGVDALVSIGQGTLEALRPETPRGLLVVNPPYGHRLGEHAALMELYARLGRTLKHRFVGWQAAVLTADPELGFRIGIRSRRPARFYNGALECRLLRFEVEPGRFFTPHGDGACSSAAPARRPPVELALRAGAPSSQAAMFANRLRKNLKTLGSWAGRNDIDCYRLYDADLPDYALAVDLYGGDELWVHVQEYRAPDTVDAVRAQQRLVEALAVIMDVLAVPPEHLALKIRERQRGRSQYRRQAAAEVFRTVREGGLRFSVNLQDYLDTGLFLDHRIIRQHIRDTVRDKRFLNLFGYTGAATAYAAAGGALDTTTVDLSPTYLEWAARNLKLNDLMSARHALVRADCMQWLDVEAAAPSRHRRRYDLIFLNPPTFSNSKRMSSSFDVQRDHAGLIERTGLLLVPRGVLLFASNRRKFRLDRRLMERWEVTDLSKSTLPRDFRRRANAHHCWAIRRRTGEPG